MRLLILLIVVSLLSGCFSTTRHATQPQSTVVTSVPPKHANVLHTPRSSAQSPFNSGFNSSFQSNIKTTLQQQYQAWAGTPYRLGGVDISGIDCSALVQNILADAFKLELPRTTREQVNVGSPVKRDSLEPLDLVFFKTGRTARHVGIYLGNGEFLHASTSRGVMISKLDNPYWTRHYWTARRPVDSVHLASIWSSQNS